MKKDKAAKKLKVPKKNQTIKKSKTIKKDKFPSTNAVLADELWNSMNQSLVALGNARNAIGPDDPKAAQLDDMISKVQKNQEDLGQQEARDALAKLTDAKVLGKLSDLTKHLQDATVQLNHTANDLNAAATVVSIAASIATTVLLLA